MGNGSGNGIRQCDRSGMCNTVKRYRVLADAAAHLCARMFAAAFVATTLACSQEPIEPAATNYRDDAARVCEALPGQAGRFDDEHTPGGIRYRVRTPANYAADIAHPLLIVYPGAGQSGAVSERHTGLTPAATAAGFIVAYADHRRLSLPVLDDLATIPGAIATQWCVDRERVFVTGHSDGGTAASAMAFRQDDGFTPAGIAPSAAGLVAEDLAGYSCPQPLPVLILHSANDKLFPGFGRGAADWWAACNGCAATTSAAKNACLDFERCPVAAPVRYCEGDGSHSQWPARNATLLQFFHAAGSTKAGEL